MTTSAAFGLMGSVAGLAVMDWLMKRTAPLVAEDDREHESMSLIGIQHREGESSTTALGRQLYAGIMGQEPNEERTERLGYGVHYAQGMTMGALYGAVRADRQRPHLDIAGGALFGLGLWLLADEAVVPLVGLKDSFSSYPPSQHLQALGGHLAYGMATAAVSHLLQLAVQRLQGPRRGERGPRAIEAARVGRRSTKVAPPPGVWATMRSPPNDSRAR